MIASPRQVAALARVIAEQATGLTEGRFPHPEAMERLMAENVDMLHAWTREAPALGRAS